MVDGNPPDSSAELDLWASGNGEALNALLPALYRDLRLIAHRYLRQERKGHTLQTTALVHEAYVRLAGQRTVAWESRAQFLALSARMMRRILVNYALARRTTKRGSAAPTLSLDEVAEVGDAPNLDVVALHEALVKLAAIDDRQARIVELRYFAGLDVEETGQILGVSRATIQREWAIARHWLYRALRTDPPSDP